MYLNIINNTSFENRRNKNKSPNEDKEELSESNEVVIENVFSEKIISNSFNSIFYGELTKNWLSINS